MLLAPRLQRLNAVTLTPFVRLVLGDDTAEVIRWNYETLGGSWERTGDLISRLKGAAVSDGHERSWSVILKIPGPIRPVIDVWQREPLLYGSGLLEKLLPPIRVPRCFGIEEPPGDEPWIWLEDVAGIPSVEWPMERFYRALRHLGECQGAWLCGARGPDYDWFNTGWWLRRDAIEAAERAGPAIRAAREHPLAAKVFAGDRGRQFQALLDDLGQLLDALERLPLTFAHADLNTGNMVAPQGSDEQTVLLDWQFGGSQVIGYDVSTVVGCCAVYEGPVYGQANEVTGPTINAYLEGIRRSGWPGDERLVRFGCLGAVTVRVTLVIPDLVLRAIQHIRDPERLATRMNYLSESLAYLLTLTKETRELASLGV